MRFPFIFIIVILVISLAIDFYILFDIRSMVKKVRQRRATWIYLSFMAVCYVLLFSLMFMPVRNEDGEILPVMWILYTYLSLFVPRLVYLVFSLFGRLVRLIFRPKRKRYYMAYTGAGIGALVFIMLWVGVLYTRHHIETNKVELASERLPDAFEGYRIVQFSDAHVGTWGNDTVFISKLVDEINALDPDMIVFTGDIVNRKTKEMSPFLNVLKRLRATDGVFSVLGNHDYGDYIDWKDLKDKKSNQNLMKEWQKEMGWDLMYNEHRFITRENDTIVLIGVENWGEPPFHQYGKLTEAYPLSNDSTYNLNDNRFKILLTHNPEHWIREVKKISNTDLTMSGHTHAMQMMVSAGEWKWSPSKYKYPTWGGLFEDKGKDGTPMFLYVNIGSGEVGMPSRLGSAYPEITEIVLRKK